MTKRDLPREARQRALGYNQLVSTLDTLDGESVIVRLASREDGTEATAGVASIVGELKHQAPARYEGHEFSIGSPYPDSDPEHPAERDPLHQRRDLRERDGDGLEGNDYFIISIKMRAMEILVHDGDSTYP